MKINLKASFSFRPFTSGNIFFHYYIIGCHIWDDWDIWADWDCHH